MSADTPHLRERIARQLSRRYRVDGLDARDLQQEAQLAMHLLAPDGGAEESHLRMAARQAITNHVRRAQEHRPQLETGSELPALALTPELSPDVLAAMRELPPSMLDPLTPQQQAVIKMTYVGGWGDHAIAQALRVCEATVRRHRADALAALREEGVELPEGGAA